MTYQLLFNEVLKEIIKYILPLLGLGCIVLIIFSIRFLIDENNWAYLVFIIWTIGSLFLIGLGFIKVWGIKI